MYGNNPSQLTIHNRPVIFYSTLHNICCQHSIIKRHIKERGEHFVSVPHKEYDYFCWRTSAFILKLSKLYLPGYPDKIDAILYASPVLALCQISIEHFVYNVDGIFNISGPCSSTYFCTESSVSVLVDSTLF